MLLTCLFSWLFIRPISFSYPLPLFFFFFLLFSRTFCSHLNNEDNGAIVKSFYSAWMMRTSIWPPLLPLFCMPTFLGCISFSPPAIPSFCLCCCINCIFSIVTLPVPPSDLRPLSSVSLLCLSMTRCLEHSFLYWSFPYLQFTPYFLFSCFLIISFLTLVLFFCLCSCVYLSPFSHTHPHTQPAISCVTSVSLQMNNKAYCGIYNIRAQGQT